MSTSLKTLVECLMEQTLPSHPLNHLYHSTITVFAGIEISFTSLVSPHFINPLTLFNTLHYHLTVLSYQTISLYWTTCIDWSGMTCCCSMDSMCCLQWERNLQDSYRWSGESYGGSHSSYQYHLESVCVDHLEWPSLWFVIQRMVWDTVVHWMWRNSWSEQGKEIEVEWGSEDRMDVLVLIRRCEDGRGTPRLSLSFLEMDEESWNTLVVVSVIGRNTYSSIEVTLQEPILSILVYRMRLSSIITPNHSQQHTWNQSWPFSA